MLHLVRIDDGLGTHGWQFRAPHWLPDGPFTVFFADSKFESADAALVAARLERDQTFAEYQLPLRPHVNRPAGPPGSRNTSGLSGIHLTNKGGSGPPSWYWVVGVSAGAGALQRNFSVARLGLEGALREAIAWRTSLTPARYSKADVEKALAVAKEKMSLRG